MSLAEIAGLAALARYLVAAPFLARYLLRARVARIPKGPTPPISVLKPLLTPSPTRERDLEATLRQNYPDFEVLFVEPGEADPARRAAALVPDVPVRFLAEGGADSARHDVLVAAAPEVRPDPLWLRDAANGMAEGDVVAFPPILFGARTTGARLRALFVNIDAFLVLLMARGAPGACPVIAYRRSVPRGAVVLSRRAARCHLPEGAPAESLCGLLETARVLWKEAPLSAAAAAAGGSAPALLLAAAVAGPARGPALLLLALHAAARVACAVVLDYRFCWDRSLVRALPLLPALWILEPLLWLGGLLPAGRGRARLWAR